MRIPCLIFFLPALLLRADGLADLRNTLNTLKGEDAVKATLQRQTWKEKVKDKKTNTTQGQAQILVEDGAGGLRLSFPRPLLATVAQEANQRAANPEAATPTRTAMAEISALAAQDTLSSAPGLLRKLSSAQVLEDRQDTYAGKPARLLVLKVDPKWDADIRKAIKSSEVAAKLWMTTDGTPLAYWQRTAFKASKFLISFEAAQTEEQRFARVGNRLVTTYRSEEEFGSGMGEVTKEKNLVTVNIQ